MCAEAPGKGYGRPTQQDVIERGQDDEWHPGDERGGQTKPDESLGGRPSRRAKR